MKKTFLLILTVLISASCISQTAPKKKHKRVKKKPKTEVSVGLPIANQWILERFDNETIKNVTKDSYIKIEGDLNRFSGSGGCNRIGGEVIIDKNNIKFDKVFATRMYCNETMKQEDLFIKNLNETNNFKIVGGELFLYKDKQLLMTLESYKN